MNMTETSLATILSAIASVLATAMFVRSIVKNYIPSELQYYIYYKVRNFLDHFFSEITLVIDEYDNLNKNYLFKVAELYLESIIPPNIKRLKISLAKKQSEVSVSLERNQEIVDTFNGVSLKWRFITQELATKYIPNPDLNDRSPVSEHRFFELCFQKKYKNMVLDSYIKHLLAKSKETEDKRKTLKLFTLGSTGRIGDIWQSVNLDHPATFETLAMDQETKKMIMHDLQKFIQRKEYYKRVGKAWKRGYLLFGPPGTGKSSLIAAIANFLTFDIYDLELTDVRTNSHLRKLLISTENKSILVVEDIDCSIELPNRIAEARANPLIKPGYHGECQVTLSGLLNFVDGLWSTCGDERLLIFTTNHKEKLDAALLRPGRMDLHIHMSYCTPCGFKMLASNYLKITEHQLFLDIEELIETTKVTPAEIGEQLMKNEEPEIALRGLIDFLEHKRTEQEEEEKEKKREIDQDKESGVAENERSQKVEINNCRTGKKD